MPQTLHEDLETGVKQVDAEHRLHASLINALEKVLRRGDDPALAERTIAQLEDFTSAHFRSEELLMRLYAYPQLDEHRQEHGRLSERMQEIQGRIAGGAASQAVEAIGAFRSSLIDHVRSADQGFARWCLAGAVREIEGLL
jgi:hemerythrin